MKLSALTFVLLPLAAQACSQYQFCHCYDSNGIPNDAITKKVCDGLGASIANMVDSSAKSDGARECKGVDDKAHNNCSWRQWCQLAGATGADSSCRQQF
jgi:hypothetical protein